MRFAINRGSALHTVSCDIERFRQWHHAPNIDVAQGRYLLILVERSSAVMTRNRSGTQRLASRSRHRSRYTKTRTATVLLHVIQRELQGDISQQQTLAKATELPQKTNLLVTVLAGRC